MSMGFQNPLHLPTLAAHIVNDVVGRAAAQCAGLGLEIQNRVDHRGLAMDGIGQYIADGARCVVKNASICMLQTVMTAPDEASPKSLLDFSIYFLYNI